MSNTQVPLLDLVAQYQSIKPEIDAAIQRVLDSGHYILGDEVSALEDEVANYLGVKHGVGVASGTDALILSLRALDISPGDEVILPAYTFFATVGAVLHVGAKPILVDIEPRTYCIDVAQVRKCITPATKAIIPVHLYGHPADMTAIIAIAQVYDLKIIEDNAQAFGANYKDHKTGSLGDMACLSFFPSKNLGGYGDGGMVVTNDDEIAEKVRMLRTHGWKEKYCPETLGYNSRLDALQAAILRVKLRFLDNWNDRRRTLAADYNKIFSAVESITAPYEAPNVKHVYHLYIIRTESRSKIQNALRDAGVSTGIYYPQPIHLTQPCLKLGYVEGDFPVSEEACRESLALPLFPEMTQGKFDTVISVLEISIDAAPVRD